MGKHNFLSKMFKPVGNTFNHVIDGVLVNPLNNITSGAGNLMSGVGTGVTGLGKGVGKGIESFGSSAGSLVSTLSNPIVLIGVGVGAIILISIIK